MLYWSGFELYSRWVPLKIGKPWTMRNFYLISHPDLMIKMPSGNRIYGYPSFPAVRVREMKKRGVLFFFRELKEKFILTCSRHAAKHWEPLIQKFLNYASLIFLFSCLCCCCCFLSPWVTDPPLPTPPHSHKVVRNLNPCVINNAKLLSVTPIKCLKCFQEICLVIPVFHLYE